MTCGKGACDRRFGWLKAWILRYVKERNCIKTVGDFKKAAEAGIAAARLLNNDYPRLLVHIESLGPKPQKTLRLMPDAFHITRPYCVSSEPSAAGHLGVRMRNNVYSDMPASIEMRFTVEEERSWRLAAALLRRRQGHMGRTPETHGPAGGQ